jgi:hypothetical protein
MTQRANYIPLPLSRDLWQPYEFDAEGAIIERKDNIDASRLPQSAAVAGPDVAALLMAERDALLAEALKNAQ